MRNHDVQALFCPQCGRELPADAPQGRCPACHDRATISTEFSGDFDEVADLYSTPVNPDASTYIPPVNGEPTIEFLGDPPVADGSGSRIGPYMLLQKIGEGGMGAVYLADQETPVRRRVAVKIIKPGLDSKQFIARFEAERQTLALMDHPNIAKVLEAGATETGSPYFVMELVRGVSITAYCDQARLTPRERLELFVPVCQAIQHAHQKGIIHRDIKPSNVLVTVTDGKPSAKVIDFGVARTIDQRLNEETLVVQFGTVIGTVEYMSPEQAETRGLDIDTRSDIYSLGILLYELLTGSTPIQCRKLPGVAFTEALRRIREEDPPKPSSRLSTTEELATIAANRKIEPARLARLVRGELDWIVMKALEKDRSRRYETANGLARDIERYLAGDPVEAGSPTMIYRLGKFARKSRALLLTAANFLALLVLGAVLATSLALRASRAEAEARQRLLEVRQAVAGMNRALEETRSAQATTALALKQSEADRRRAEADSHQAESVNKFLIEIFRSPELGTGGQEIKVADLLDRALANLDTSFTGSANVKGDLYSALGDTYYGLRLFKKAVGAHEKARNVRRAVLGASHPATLASMNKLGLAYLNDGRITDAIKLFGETLKLRRKELGPDHPDTLGSISNLANAYRSAGRLNEAIAMHQQALKHLKTKPGIDHAYTLASMSNLALDYQQAAQYPEAINLFQETLKLRQAKLGTDHPDTLVSMASLGQAYKAAGKLSEAIAILEETLELRQAKLGTDHPDTLRSMSNLALVLEASNRQGDAEALWNDLLKAQRRKLPPDDLNLAETLGWLANNLRLQRRNPEAERLLGECLTIREKKLPDDWFTFNIRSVLGGYLLREKKFAEAEPLLLSSYNEMKARESKIPPYAKARLTEAGERIIQLYKAWSQPEKAKEWRAKLGQPDPKARSKP